jgi:ABC-type Zn2+ transport system substrate-binding protein/surface adhesin
MSHPIAATEVRSSQPPRSTSSTLLPAPSTSVDTKKFSSSLAKLQQLTDSADKSHRHKHKKEKKEKKDKKHKKEKKEKKHKDHSHRASKTSHALVSLEASGVMGNEAIESASEVSWSSDED